MTELISRRLVSRISPALAIALGLLAASHCRQPSPRAEAKSMDEVRISLDVTPMMDPVATFVSLQGTLARAIRYSRPRLAVIGAGLETVPEERLRRIADLLQKPRFRAALGRRSFAGEGLSRGDQFHLAVAAPSEGECFGFVEQAPAEVKNLIRELLSLASDLDKVSLAAGYLRSEPIESYRARGLRSKLDFRSLRELPPDLRLPVTEAIASPRAFVALRPQQLARLSEWGEGRHQLYLTTGRDDHELTLFRGGATSVPPGDQREQNP